MSANPPKDFPVRVLSPFGENVLLLKRFTGTETLGRPFHFDLTFASENPELDYQRIIGERLTVFLDTTGPEPRCFNGFVSRFAHTKFEGNLTEYRATVVPWLWFLTRTSDCRIFQNMKVPDILKQVFREFGFSDIVDHLHDTYRTMNYCVQYRETAFNFVSRLMEEEGIYYFFRHEDRKHSIVLCDSAASHDSYPGYEDIRYRPAAEKVEETLTEWAVQYEVQSGGYGTTNFNFTKPKAQAARCSFFDRDHSLSRLEQFEFLGSQSPFDEYSPGAQNENERYSKLRLQELQVQFETYTGEGDVRGICPGAWFLLKDHPVRAFDRKYLATSAAYDLECGSFETAADYGKDFKFHARLTAVPLDIPYRAPSTTPRPIVHGPQTATVVGPQGQKVFTDPTGYGMVKVQFAWDRVGKNDQHSSCFMRVSQSWAGKNWGDIALPHVGDEVIVEFLEGNPDRPIITGRVYNQSQVPPLTLPANQYRRIMRDDYGNSLIFDATPGDEHIRLYSPHHKSGLTLGRSSVNVTQSDTIAMTIGAQITANVGVTLQQYFGSLITSVLGETFAVNLGSVYNFNLAQQFQANLGTQISYVKGTIISKGDSDDNKSVDGGMLVTAAEHLNLVGGRDNPLGSTVLYGDSSKLELTAGSALVAPEVVDLTTKLLIAGSVAMPLVSALISALSTQLVDSNPPAYFTTGGDIPSSDTAPSTDHPSPLDVSNKDFNYTSRSDQHSLDTRRLSTQQIGLLAGAGAAEALGLALKIALYLKLKANTALAPKKIQHTSPTASLVLQTKPMDPAATLMSKLGIKLDNQDPANPSTMQMNTSGIKISDPLGQVEIWGGANGNIVITKTGTVKLTSTSQVVVKGAMVDVNGNLTVLS